MSLHVGCRGLTDRASVLSSRCQGTKDQIPAEDINLCNYLYVLNKIVFLWHLVAFIFLFLSFTRLYSRVYDLLLYNAQQTDHRLLTAKLPDILQFELVKTGFDPPSAEVQNSMRVWRLYTPSHHGWISSNITSSKIVLC